MWRNSKHSYGLIHIGMHWGTALAVAGMLALGLYMVELGYYDPWYHRAPAIHKSIGLLLFGLFCARLAWRFSSVLPGSLANSAWQRRVAAAVHGLLYVCLLGMFLSGYLIASADGRAIPVFDWFAVPAVVLPVDNQEEFAGDVHEVFAWTLMALVGIHTLAALKHHFINRDGTLRRMLWPTGSGPL